MRYDKHADATVGLMVVSSRAFLRYGAAMSFSYLLYFLIAVGLTGLLSAAFARFRGEQDVASLKDDQDFERRMVEVEKQAERMGVIRSGQRDGHDDEE